MRRNSPEWLQFVGETGRWDEPPFWESEQYRAQSPWSPAEIADAFQALRGLYPPKVVKQILKKREWPLFGLLVDSFVPSRSSLLALGLDLHLVQPWSHASLLRQLRNAAQYESGRFELAIWAAFVRAQLSVRYEPLRRQGGKNPDFLLTDLGGPGGLLMEVKMPHESARNTQAYDFYSHIIGFGDPSCPVAPFHIELTRKSWELFQDKRERSQLWRRAEELGGMVREAKARLVNSPSFPAEENLEGLIRIICKKSVGAATVGSFCGFPIDTREEASRIVRNCLADGADQIERSGPGLVLIRINYLSTPSDAVGEAQCWLQERNGRLHNLLGVLLIFDGAYQPAAISQRAVLVWRESTPNQVRESDIWKRLTIAVNWYNDRVFEWQAT
ncbi:MAG: hypothetical protein HY650_00385 [Acidobacteria bacterium]|nr:hypothetical protein [Acidobacteriota bacterium]